MADRTIPFQFKFSVRGNFIQGQFQRSSSPNGEWTSRSPADFSDELGRFQYSYSSVDDGVASARSAEVAWRQMPVAERAKYLKSYQGRLKARSEELAEVIAREIGKPLWDARTEVLRMINQVENALGEGLNSATDFEVSSSSENTREIYRYRSVGVLAVIGSFSSSGSHSNGHIVSSVLMGNTIVFKPSEKAPMVGQVMAECLDEAQFPRGVINLIQGEKEMGRRLCVHDGIDGILFTGSYEVGIRIKQDTLQQHWKLVVLGMGGKNSSIVWKDANLENSIYETLTSAFSMSGQNCTSTSRILVHNKILQEFIHYFHKRSKAFSIGHPLENPFMGPLIDQSSIDRYMKFLGIASREGCEVVMRGKILELSCRGHYATPSICFSEKRSLEQVRKSVYEQTELFAPNVMIIGVDTIDEAIALANSTQYGLAASVYSESKEIYHQCLNEIEVGLLNWNRGTAGVSLRFPIGGRKKSGIYFPAALPSVHTYSTSLASLEIEKPGAVQSRLMDTPGLNWNNE
jgi:succinylglutamic semialdehyde dehydrogenase